MASKAHKLRLGNVADFDFQEVRVGICVLVRMCERVWKRVCKCVLVPTAKVVTMSVCVCACVRVCMCVRVRLSLCESICVCMCVCVCECLRARVCVCAFIFLYEREGECTYVFLLV